VLSSLAVLLSALELAGLPDTEGMLCSVKSASSVMACLSASLHLTQKQVTRLGRLLLYVADSMEQWGGLTLLDNKLTATTRWLWPFDWVATSQKSGLLMAVGSTCTHVNWTAGGGTTQS
jgi:hypothetical protein